MLQLYLSLTLTENDREKVTRIYTRYYGLMMFTAERILGEKKAAAPDIVHNAMLKIIDKFDVLDLSDVKRTRNLCVTIVRNKCYDYLSRKDTNSLPIEDCFDEEECVSVEEIVVSEETVDAVKRVIGSLGERYKDICIMRFVYGYKDKEIAGLLDINPETVRSRISRARKILIKAIKEEGYYE